MTDPRRNAIAVVGLLAALSLAPLSCDAERFLRTAATMEGSEAQAVAAELATRFRSPYVNRIVMAVRGLPSPSTDEGRAALGQIVARVAENQSVSGTISYLDWPDALFIGRGGGTFVIIGLVPASGEVESLIPQIRRDAERARRAVASRYPAAALEITGETPLNFDLRRTSAEDARTAEVRILPITLLLLVVAFRSIRAALLPLVTGFLTMAVTLGAAALVARHWPLSILVQNIAAMLGLGLGIDYALLLVSRFREARRDGLLPAQAADLARQQSGHTILVSAATVAIGFAALLAVPISDLRSIGVAGMIVAAASVFLSLTILPAALAFLDPRVEGTRIWSDEAARETRWRAWSARMTGRPGLALAASAPPLILLAVFGARLSSELPRGDWLPDEAESVRALRTLERMERAGIVQSLRVVFDAPPGVQITSDTGWEALGRFSRHLESDARTDRVLSAFSLTRGYHPFLAMVPPAIRTSLLSSDGRAAVIEVLPRAGLTPAEQIAWVRELRSMSTASFGGAPIRIGGIPALNADYEEIVNRNALRVLAFVLTACFVALLIGFGSVLVAVKAVALNLLSVGAAFGALVLVFQDGWGGGLFGVPGGTQGIFPIVPILTFAIVFGLSMDYEVFLVARVREARRSGMDESSAIAEGLAKTAGVITSAAAVMVAVFAAFVFGELLIIKMLGFTLAAAVIIDATVVRLIIGPALLRLAGDLNWWPRGLTVAPLAARIRSQE